MVRGNSLDNRALSVDCLGLFDVLTNVYLCIVSPALTPGTQQQRPETVAPDPSDMVKQSQAVAGSEVEVGDRLGTLTVPKSKREFQ